MWKVLDEEEEEEECSKTEFLLAVCPNAVASALRLALAFFLLFYSSSP
jgi:hypothetical protein